MENKEKYEGHGSNWSAIFVDQEEGVSSWLPKIVESKDSEIKKHNDLAGIINFKSPLKSLALIKINEDNSELLSAYPFLQISNPITVKIIKIEEWSSGLEAVIYGEIGPVCIHFFDTLYFLNKDTYKIDEWYTFNIGAIAYSFQKRIKDLVITPDEGLMKGETLHTRKMTAYLDSKDYGGEFSFICPFVSFAGETKAFDENFQMFPYFLRNDSSDTLFSLPMYVNTKIVKEDFKQNDSVQGSAWLQGYLVDSFDSEEE